MKAKRIFQFLLTAPLLLLPACSTQQAMQADALREMRGTTPKTEISTDQSITVVQLPEISVLPASLLLKNGQRGTVAFSLPEAVSGEGLYLKITTNIPDSIIMPEAMIPAGERSINVPMEGSSPAEGFLFVEAEGYQPIQIPVSVR
ncbi:MAG: hypothetical protein ACON39_08555 [Coraliomargaritaceae bacterium]